MDAGRGRSVLLTAAYHPKSSFALKLGNPVVRRDLTTNVGYERLSEPSCWFSDFKSRVLCAAADRFKRRPFLMISGHR